MVLMTCYSLPPPPLPSLYQTNESIFFIHFSFFSFLNKSVTLYVSRRSIKMIIDRERLVMLLLAIVVVAVFFAGCTTAAVIGVAILSVHLNYGEKFT